MARHRFDRRLPSRRVGRAPAAAVDETGWPGALPAVRQLLRDGLVLGPATVLVGDNGTGKSTLGEAIAMAYGLNAEGGSTHARHGTRASESPPAGRLRVEREVGASRWGYFLRAETMHGFYTYLESNPAREGREAHFHEMSHGESFLEVLRSRFDGSGWQETAWDDLALVDHHRRFLGGPERYLRHVLE